MSIFIYNIIYCITITYIYINIIIACFWPTWMMSPDSSQLWLFSVPGNDGVQLHFVCQAPWTLSHIRASSWTHALHQFQTFDKYVGAQWTKSADMNFDSTSVGRFHRMWPYCAWARGSLLFAGTKWGAAKHSCSVWTNLEDNIYNCEEEFVLSRPHSRKETHPRIINRGNAKSIIEYVPLKLKPPLVGDVPWPRLITTGFTSG